jgi:hypothetical protein
VFSKERSSPHACGINPVINANGNKLTTDHIGPKMTAPIAAKIPTFRADRQMP